MQQPGLMIAKRVRPFLYVGPAIIVVLGVLGYGVVYGVGMSFFRVDVRYAESPYVGLANYQELLSDPHFLNSFQTTLWFVVGSVAIGFLGALAFALSIHQCRKYSGFYRAFALVPFLVSGIATAVIFRFLFGGRAGVVNHLIQAVGLGRVPFLSHPELALFITILARVWTIFPLATLLLHAGLLSVDPNLYEVAKIDGAGPVTTFFRITLPLITPMIGVALMWLSFASFNMFDITLALTGGGPGRATEVLAVYMYRVGFQQLVYSRGSAVMVIILALNICVSLTLLKLFRR